MPNKQGIRVSWLGREPYLPIWKKMQQQAVFMAENPKHNETIWLCEHEPVYTTGRRGLDNRRKPQLPAPLHQVDRGGETTFHGPGQILMYPLLRLQERKLGVRAYVHLLEASCINLLAGYDIEAYRRTGFPGVWLPEGKIAAIGVRIRHGISYHGMALNIHVDPTYFQSIDPCGLGFSAVNTCPSLPPQQKLKAYAMAWAEHFQRLLRSSHEN